MMDQDYRYMHYVEVHPADEKATISYDIPARARVRFKEAVQDLTKANKAGLVVLRSETHMILESILVASTPNPAPFKRTDFESRIGPLKKSQLKTHE